MKDRGTDHLTAPVDAEAAHGSASSTVDLPDRWRLLELLGSGGQATVWLAEDRTLGQKVALKILPADADERTRARWLEEVRQGRRLSHPNLIRIFDVVETSDRPVAVMEYLPGGTLADRVAAEAAQQVDDVIRWAREVLGVLAYLHDHRVVHRDIKPSNLLLAEDGTIKLSDLGLVRSLDRSSDLTRTLEGVGTPRFMSPEQLRGEAPAPACDLYSLGVTLFQLLTGRLPFEGDSAFQVADGHLHVDPPPVRDLRPDCPRWLARYVERLLEKDPRARYRTADAAARALDRRRIGMSRRMVRRLAAGIVVAAAATVAVAYWRSLDNVAIDRVETAGSTVLARDADGRRLWSQERPGLVPKVAVADFVGGPAEEVTVGWSVPTKDSVPGQAITFELLSTSGDQLRVWSRANFTSLAFSNVAPVWSLNDLATADLSGDGRDLVWAVINPTSYPSVIGATSFRATGEKPLVTFANSGHVQHLTVADLDGDGRDEVIAVVINNPLGFQHTLVVFGARSRTSGVQCGDMYSPDINADRRAKWRAPDGCLSFTPLGSDIQIADPPTVRDGLIELVIDGDSRRFDDWGNPESSVLFGRGGGPRASFWIDVAVRCARLRLAPTLDSAFTMAELRSDHPWIVGEPPVEVAAVLAVARALASGEHRDNAIALLGDAVQRFPSERDLELRLGEQLLMAGDRTEGRRRLRDSINIAGEGRNHTELTQWLILDAAVHGDAAAYAETRRFLDNLTASSKYETVRFLDVAWLFFQGQWSDPRIADADPGRVHHWVRFLQDWSRFEASGDAEHALASARELARFVEVEDLAGLLEARVGLSSVEPLSTAQRVEGILSNLRAGCRVDYQACVWVPLAEWLMGEALSDIEGREPEARAALTAAAKQAPGTWIARPVTR